MYTEQRTLMHRSLLWLVAIFFLSSALFMPGGVLKAQTATTTDPFPPTPGCTDPDALNYDIEATEDDGTCEFPPNPDPATTTDPVATTTDPVATSTDPVLGCTDEEATNFDPDATEDDGSCVFESTDPVDAVATGTITGTKRNNDGSGGMANWTIELYDGTTLVDSAVTNVDGVYSFTNVVEGTYTVCETKQGGWLQIFPATGTVCANGTFGYEVTVASGTDLIGDIDFRNTINPGGGEEEEERRGGGGVKIEMVDEDGDPDERDNDEDDQSRSDDSSDDEDESNGGGSTETPDPQVLGEQVSALPAGAPGAGAGGSSTGGTLLLVALLGVLMSIMLISYSYGSRRI